MTTPTITIKNLTLHWQQPLFDDFTIQLNAGKWTALLGTSGVGKSTLLRFIAGLLPTSSDKNANIIISDNKPLKNRLSYMAQEDCLLPWLNAMDNILLPYRLTGKKITTAIKQQVLELLRQLGLNHATHLTPEKLSGGMRQRVALARIFFDNKPIVLMDEPFSALDTITRLKLQDVAAELLANKTVLMVTHDPLEALRLADEIYVMTDQPVQLSDPILLNSPRPRNIENQELITQQSQLLSLLAKKNTQEATLC
ncbi:MAG: ABC transporter ATP-binding protein [Pseudomonadota bacterium]